MESTVPKEAPTMQRKRLFFNEVSETGSLNTLFQWSRFIKENAFMLGTMEYGTNEV